MKSDTETSILYGLLSCVYDRSPFSSSNERRFCASSLSYIESPTRQRRQFLYCVIPARCWKGLAIFTFVSYATVSVRWTASYRVRTRRCVCCNLQMNHSVLKTWRESCPVLHPLILMCGVICFCCCLNSLFLLPVVHRSLQITFERNHPLVVSFFLFAREYDAGGSVAQGELWLFVVVLPSRLFLVFYPLSMQIV